MGTPAARILDTCVHVPTGKMTPGIGAVTVLIGKLPAWRAVNPIAAVALQAAGKAAAATVQAGEATAKGLAAVPGGQPAAIAAEAAAKGAALGMFAGAMAGAMVPSPSGGIPDTHVCMMPSIGFAPLPHGPGMVIDGSKTVMVNGLPLTKVGCTILEAIPAPAPNKVIMGQMNVMIGG